MMANSVSAEPLAGPQDNPVDDDNALTQQTKTSEGANQTHLRIVHNAEHPDTPNSDMPPANRRSQAQATDRPPAMLDRTVQAQIGRLLRDVFADVAAEPVPERFVTLLEQLETREKPR